MIAFNEVFPVEANGETLILSFRNDKVLSDGEYVFYEWYCSNPDCDCKDSIAEVIYIHPITKEERVVTAIEFSWADSEKSEWRCAIEKSWRKTKVAKKLLAEFREIIKDPEFSEPFKRHYKLVKTKYKSNKIAHGKPKQVRKEKQKKIGRNDLCPCGSGKKFKKCCLKTSQKG